MRNATPPKCKKVGLLCAVLCCEVEENSTGSLLRQPVVVQDSILLVTMADKAQSHENSKEIKVKSDHLLLLKAVQW